MLMSMLPYWPLAVGLVVLVVAAVLQHTMGRIPNQVTFGAIAAAWAAAVLLVESGVAPAAGGGIRSSIGCTVISFVMLLPFYGMGCLPAGCIKTQMAFSSWVGCALAFGPAATVCALATFVGVVVTAIGVAIAYCRRPTVVFPLQTTLSVGSIGGVIAIFVFAAGRMGG